MPTDDELRAWLEGDGNLGSLYVRSEAPTSMRIKGQPAIAVRVRALVEEVLRLRARARMLEDEMEDLLQTSLDEGAFLDVRRLRAILDGEPTA